MSTEGAIVKAIALRFARAWYDRPQSGCDEATLGSMLEDVIAKARQSARDEYRERAAKSLSEVLP